MAACTILGPILTCVGGETPKRQRATIHLYNTTRYRPHKGLLERGQKCGATAYIINRRAMEKVLLGVMIDTKDKKGITLHMRNSRTVRRAEADFFIYDLSGSKWSVGETYVYTYNCSNPSTLHGRHDRLHIRIASRSLFRARSHIGDRDR